MAAPRKGRRPGHVSYTPWRGFPERPWFDALFVWGAAMTRRPRIVDLPANTAPPLPLGSLHWKAVCTALRLSPKQAQVAELMLRGLCDKEIAAVMGIGEPTVRTYLDRISARTRSHGRMELAMRVLAVSHEVLGHVLGSDDSIATTQE
jgi:DNA-binding CsgD family transcriptional regulator